jgi:hypothetical protein
MIENFALFSQFLFNRREIYRTGAKVQIIEPGAFKTPIWKPLQQMSVDKMASLPAEIKSQLTDDAADKSTFCVLGL